VLGVGIHPLNMPSAVERVFAGVARDGMTGFVTITGVHGVVESQRDDELRHIHNRSYLSTPDGMPMVWMAHWNGFRQADRVYGPDLMLEVFRRSEATGEGHYLFGGGDGVVELLAERLQATFPKARIVGTATPPFRPLTQAEQHELANTIRERQPHFFWVGLSTPKQEKFMHGFLQAHPTLLQGAGHGMLMFGVGAAFDFHAGRLKQAPRWMQRAGLEWFFRLCMEPRRLCKRYAVSNTHFLIAVFLQMTKWKSYPLER
jgi:N-acetylglucosaminyldiphosphoundecaprenol N-acetyl-beta-D-mannosaminyltransferase